MPVKKQKPSYKWVIMIYAVASDKNSEEGMTNFFKELEEIGKEIDKKKGQVKLKIVLQGYRDWDSRKEKKAYYAKRFEIKSNFLKKGRISPDIVYTRLYSNMGDPNALSDFIVWCKDNYPAEHYLLLIWGHGAQYGMFTGVIKDSTWIAKEPKSFSMALQGKNTTLSINELSPVKQKIEKQYSDLEDVLITFKKKNKKGMLETDLIKRKVINNGTAKIKPNDKIIPPTVIYYFDVEKDNRIEKLRELIPGRPIADSLKIEEICKSLWDTGHYIKSSGTIEVIMIFGCAMQTFELAYELSKCGSLGCKYLIASEELIYWSGYNYKESFLCLLKNPDMSAKELGKQIIIDTKEKPDRNLKIEDEGHENKNKDDWAISCVNIKKCAELAKRLDKIAMKIFDLYDYTIDSYTPGNKKIKKDKALKFNDTLRKARAYCHYFGENAFPQSYIDTTWFLKMLNELIQSSYLSNDKIHLISYPSYRKLKYLKSELKKVISFLEIENENHLILKKWVGSKLSSDKKIRIFYFSGDEVYDQVNSSPGAHGIGIYFPISGEENEKDSGNKLFFESHSDYDLEFVKIKKNGWRHMLKDYWTKNVELTTEVITKDKLQSNEEIP